MRVLRLAWLLLLVTLKRRLAYRGDLLIQSLDELARGFIALALLQVYVSKTEAIGGYSEAQLLFVLGFSMVPIGLFHCLCSNLYQLSGEYIINGSLDRVLLRPYPTFLQICFDRIAVEDLSGVVLGSAVMVYAAARIPGFDASATHLLLLALMLLSAFGVVVAVFMAFAASGFWFEDRVGMVPPVYNLMEFGRWPTRIFHRVLQLLITLLVPFAFVAFYPASLFVGGEGYGWLPLATPLVAAIALLLASRMWALGLRRYASAGS